MPIVIRHNGVLNDLTAGLAQGIEQGQKLAEQQAAVEDAKKRRAQEQQRLDMAQSQQDFERGIQTSDEAFKASQRAYTGTVQGQAQEDRTRLASERSAAQQGNAAALAGVQATDPARAGLGAAVAGGASQGGPLGAAVGAARFSAQDQAAMLEAQNVARHMDPERGRQYVLDEETRIKKARAEEMRPRLLKAWQDTLTRGQTGDPNDPASAVMSDPKIVGRAQTAIAALQAGADPEPFAAQLSAQMQDVQEKRAAVRRNVGFKRQIEGRIASAQNEADSTLDENRALELSDRITEAQSYMDAIDDPSLEPQDARELHAKAMAALHGRGTVGAQKAQRSMYRDASELAQKDVAAMLLTGPAALKALDERRTFHLKQLQDEAGTQAATSTRGGSPEPRPPVQGPVLPGTGGAVGDGSAGAPVSQTEPDEFAGAPKSLAEWKLTEPAARDQWLTKIALKDPQTAVQIAAQLGLKGKPASIDPKTHQPRGEASKAADKADLLSKIEGAANLDAYQNAVATYQRIYGALPADIKVPSWAKRE